MRWIWAMCLLAGCAPSSRPQPPAASHALPSPLETSAREEPRFPGLVLPQRALDLSASLAARVSVLHVRLGQRVRAGQVLAELDTTVMRSELAGAQAAAKTADAEVERCRVEHSYAALWAEKMQKLHDSPEHLISEDDWQRAEHQVRASAARLRAAEATAAERATQIKRQQQQVAEAEIRAPFDGLIAGCYAEEGSLVAVGGLLVRLISEQPQRLRFAVPEDVAVSAGECVSAHGASLDQAVLGRVEHVAPEVEAVSRQVWVEARLEPARGSHAREIPLRAGSRVAVALGCQGPSQSSRR